MPISGPPLSDAMNERRVNARRFGRPFSVVSGPSEAMVSAFVVEGLEK